MKFQTQSAVTLNMSLNKDEIEILKDMMQNPISEGEGDVAEKLRHDIFDACVKALRSDLANAN